MSYTVVWQPSAERKLAELWTTAEDREALAKAADEMDAVLARDPYSVGESRIGPTRVLFVPPLAAYYDVKPDDRLVSVWALWTRKKPS